MGKIDRMSLALWLTILLLLTFPALGKAKIKIKSHKDESLVYQGSLQLVIKGCKKTPLVSFSYGKVKKSYRAVSNKFKKQYTITTQIPERYRYIETYVHCGGKTFRKAISLTHISSPLQLGKGIANTVRRREDSSKLKWDWGPAIMLYGLNKVAEQDKKAKADNDYFQEYYLNWFKKGIPVINWADKVAPVLPLYERYLNEQDDWSWPIIDKAIRYLKTAERNDLGSLDHFGTAWMSWIFPSSIWVDSLMMWNLLSLKYGIHGKDPELLNFATKQPLIFAEKLEDPKTGLWFHAWNVKKDRPYPKNNVPWLRGNGWVLASFADLLEELPKTHSRYSALKDAFVRLAKSSINYQLPSGQWDTLMSTPGKGYEETSGSALVAYGMAKGFRLGILEEKFQKAAMKTFKSLVNRVTPRKNKAGEIVGWNLPEISWLTMPYGKIGYKALTRRTNMDYGLGAILMLSAEMNLH